MQLDAGRDPERFWCAAAGEAREVAPALSDPDVTCALREGSGISIWLGDQEPLVQLAKSEHGVALVQGRPDGLGDDFATALLSA